MTFRSLSSYLSYWQASKHKPKYTAYKKLGIKTDPKKIWPKYVCEPNLIKIGFFFLKSVVLCRAQTNIARKYTSLDSEDSKSSFSPSNNFLCTASLSECKNIILNQRNVMSFLQVEINFIYISPDYFYLQCQLFGGNIYILSSRVDVQI